MSKLINDLKYIFEDVQNEYAGIVTKRINEYYKIISIELKKAVKDTSNGLVPTYTYNLHQTVEEQIIQPFEWLAEGLEERFENDGIDVELKVTYDEDRTRDAKFTFSGWA